MASLPPEVPRRLRLLVRPDTILRWHRDLLKQPHARTCQRKRPGRLVPCGPSVCSFCGWSGRTPRGDTGECTANSPCTASRSRLRRAGNPQAGRIDPSPERASVTWAAFLRSQADALLACDVIEPITLNGQRQYILAVIEHATRRIRVLGTTAHPTAAWVIQVIKNVVMDLGDAGCRARFLIRDQDGKFPALVEEVLVDAGIQIVLTGIRMPRMNAVMDRWVQSCRRELLDRCLLWNERHLRHALREYEEFSNQHRAHQALDQAAPLRAVPDPITDPARLVDLNVRRRDRLGGGRLNCVDGVFRRCSAGRCGSAHHQKRRPYAADERHHGAMDPDLPARAAGSNLDLEPASPSACAARVRDLL